MFDFTVTDKQITVGSSYCQKPLNEYFAQHKLKRDDFPQEQINDLIDAVAFVLDGDEEYINNSDYLMIEEMLM